MAGKYRLVNVVSKARCIFVNKTSNIDNVDYPDRDMMSNDLVSTRRDFESDNGKTTHMVTSRGCPYKCKYCVSGNINYRNFVKRSHKNIINEMIYLKTKYGYTDIIFYDDCFFNNLDEHLHLHMRWKRYYRRNLGLIMEAT